ncbi:MAG: hypothetical protein KDD89_01735, partial [Anaerolineales bacterium]|nr:hypothetical protein [Anaerolineales bacterium]
PVSVDVSSVTDLDNPDVTALVTLANEQFDAAQEAQQNGNWSEYGAQLDALEETLTELTRLVSELEATPEEAP